MSNSSSVQSVIRSILQISRLVSDWNWRSTYNVYRQEVLISDEQGTSLSHPLMKRCKSWDPQFAKLLFYIHVKIVAEGSKRTHLLRVTCSVSNQNNLLSFDVRWPTLSLIDTRLNITAWYFSPDRVVCKRCVWSQIHFVFDLFWLLAWCVNSNSLNFGRSYMRDRDRNDCPHSIFCWNSY